VKVELLDQSTEESVAGLLAEAIDVALVVQPPLKHGSGLIFEKLLELPIGIIVPHLSHCHRQPLRCISGILCAAEQETIRSRHSSRPSVQFQEKLTTRVITADKGRRRIGVWRPASQHLCRRALAKIVFCTKANFHFRLRSA
jgi:DNA-binding transcriptional LysR family regulator